MILIVMVLSLLAACVPAGPEATLTPAPTTTATSTATQTPTTDPVTVAPLVTPAVSTATPVPEMAPIRQYQGMEIISVYDLVGYVDDVKVVGKHAYIVGNGSGLQIVDISNPERPSIVGICDLPGKPIRLAVAGNYAYVAAYDAGMRVVDISDPAVPKEVGS
ncbi:MAG: hypothetical protein IBX69_12165 [Anaerolineales bacterium]|nr:hypothetical protein [Anaerolineales bacterium]